MFPYILPMIIPESFKHPEFRKRLRRKRREIWQDLKLIEKGIFQLKSGRLAIDTLPREYRPMVRRRLKDRIFRAEQIRKVMEQKKFILEALASSELL